MGDDILDETVIIKQTFGYGEGAAHEYDTGLTVREWKALSQGKRDQIIDEAYEEAKQYIEVYPKTENGYDLPE